MVLGRVAKARIVVEDDGELEIAQRAIDEYAFTVVSGDCFDRLWAREQLARRPSPQQLGTWLASPLRVSPR
ncbi:MAG: hypothetical protein ACYCUM_12535 [Solirubrobacteraceae bacterium]